MADVTFSAWVEEVLVDQDSGHTFALKTTETHRVKDPESGQYHTDARTFRDVKVSRASGINLGDFAKGDLVKITGHEKTEKRETRNGQVIFPLIVWADSIEKVDRNAPPRSYPTGDVPF